VMCYLAEQCYQTRITGERMNWEVATVAVGRDVEGLRLHTRSKWH
jgi:hypothetical protein